MKQLSKNGLKLVDFFCGAGIGAVGFKLAGYDIIDAFDNKQYAVDTYNKNIGNHARVLDIRKVNSEVIPDADVYVGGFPCNPFSLGGEGKGVYDEKNGDLGYHFYRLVKSNKPKAFIIENVKGIISKRHYPFFNKLIENFSEDYTVEWKLLNCYDYGVPQLRERVFVVGIRKDLNEKFEFFEEALDKMSLLDAIGDLPNPGYNNGIPNHNEYYDGGYSPRYVSRNRQKQWNEPSFTIVSTARQLPLHPDPPNYDIRKMNEDNRKPPRRFTVRECLRIQSVPDWFSFDESIHIDKQFERCSGIPSLIAYKIGVSLAEKLKKCN